MGTVPEVRKAEACGALSGEVADREARWKAFSEEGRFPALSSGLPSGRNSSSF
jgi:hypothetical protein